MDLGRGERRERLGSGIDGARALSPRGRAPWSRGAYTCARLGCTAGRARLAEPLGDRLYFAGEAMAGRFSQTCDGAFLSGQAAAKEIAARLK